MSLKNDGLFWNNRDIADLQAAMMYRSDQTLSVVAAKLGRTESACATMLRNLWRMEVLRKGKPEDTLVSYKARVRKQEAATRTRK